MARWMQACVVLYGVTISCFLLIGPWGPCGPDSAIAVVLLIVGVPLAWGTGFLTALSLIASAAERETRRRTILAMTATAVIVALLTFAYQLAHPDPGGVVYTWMIGAWAWLGTTALVCVITSASVSLQGTQA